MDPNNLTTDTVYQIWIEIRVPSEDLSASLEPFGGSRATATPLDALMARDNYSGQNESETMELRKKVRKEGRTKICHRDPTFVLLR